MSTYPSTPETVCLQCGDVGFSNAFVYCIKCLEFAVHRYCLGVIPKSVDEFVRWICDDCIADDQNQHLLHSTSEHDAGHAGTGMENNDVVEEHVHESGPSRSHEACVKIDLVECSESDNDSDLSGSGVNAEAAVLLAPEDTKRCRQSSSQSHAVAKIEDDLIFSELSADTSPRGSVEKKHKGPGIGTQRAAMTAEKSDINLRRESHVCKDRMLESKDHSSIPADCNTSAAPVKDPIWRGSFNICNNNEDDILEGIMAHMSISACHKVYNEARQFRPVLHLKILSRCHVWPKSFEQSEPVAGDIALYFFPSESSEQVYDNLVDEMVEDDLALKGIVQNAELLVFPSTKLPLSYWRFQGKYYLWGVFREKQPVASPSPSCRRESSRDRSRSSEGETASAAAALTMKNVGGWSPRSPLSNCSSYGSCNPLTKSLP